jgi:riboflavin kinase/FMN adenylyltransferase
MWSFTTLPPKGWHEDKPVVATLGNFDGLHRGHLAIVERVIEQARQLGGIPTVVTFDPHPQRVLYPERAPHLMLTSDQKARLVARAGIEALVVIPFDRPLAQKSAEQFVAEVLVPRIEPRELYVGPEFRFGSARGGDVQLLAQLGARFGFTAAAVEAVHDSGERISASRIRAELEQGRVAEAARLLGRPAALIGTIVHGEGRGKKQLVPTANLAPENEFLPARGVYISRFRRGEVAIPGVTNIGVRPTFGDRRLTIETYLPGFDGDLYGQRVELELLERLRDERRFETVEALLEQIQKDLAAFTAYFSAPGASSR